MRLNLLLLCWLLTLPTTFASADARVFEFSYELLPTAFPEGEAVDIFIPLPQAGVGQEILVASLATSVPGSPGREERYGNSFYHIHRPAGSGEAVSASLRWTVRRASVNASGVVPLSPREQRLFLQPNNRVPVGHEILNPILDEIRAARTDDSPGATARAIYDWVVDNVEYKKVGTGWGNGDTFWACNARYGNCTDFHALFISLARTEGIPARFEIGFPVPVDRDAGSIGGYHCWVQIYLPERGWLPIDASEAAKHPELREQLFGSQPADRIHFTTGRDLVVSAASGEQPLNYFIYPYVEVGGKPWQGKLETRFSYAAVDDP